MTGTVVFMLLIAGLFTASADWNIVWSDEFNGTSLNTNVWYVQGGNCNGWGFNELQYYAPENCYVSTGALHVVARDQPTNGSPFTSGRIDTSFVDSCTDSDYVPLVPGSFAKAFGKFEFRLKLPVGTGLWPQIWMYPRASPYVTWPDCGEIDVLEATGQTGYAQGTIHYSGYGAYYAGLYISDVREWHTYTLAWYTNAIEWLVDGVTNGSVTSWTPPSGYSFPAPFDWPFYILINLAVGGGYVGNPTSDQIRAYLPAEMQIDYIRVYDQTEPLALSLTRSNEFVILSWPSNIVCHLQSQKNISSSNGATNWFDVVGATNPYVVAPNTENSFYRLASP